MDVKDNKERSVKPKLETVRVKQFYMTRGQNDPLLLTFYRYRDGYEFSRLSYSTYQPIYQYAFGTEMSFRKVASAIMSGLHAGYRGDKDFVEKICIKQKDDSILKVIVKTLSDDKECRGLVYPVSVKFIHMDPDKHKYGEQFIIESIRPFKQDFKSSMLSMSRCVSSNYIWAV